MKTNVILINILFLVTYGSSYSQISPKTIINEKQKYSTDAIEFKHLSCGGYSLLIDKENIVKFANIALVEDLKQVVDSLSYDTKEKRNVV